MFIQEITKAEAYFDNQEENFFDETIGILNELIYKMERRNCDGIEFSTYDGGDTYRIETLKEVREKLRNIKKMEFVF